MIEVRGIIKNIIEAKKKIEGLGGKFLSNYKFKDTIYSENNENNLSEDFLRLRSYFKNNWRTKDFILIRKKTKFKKSGKISKILLKKEFDNKKEVIEYIKKNFPKFRKIVEYSREGWQYQLNNNRIFIEQIKGYKPSIEIESENNGELMKILNGVNASEILKESLPEIMRKINKK